MSHTTRSAREGEEDGVAYNFVSQQQMKEVNGDDDNDDDDGYNYDHNLTMILLIVRRIDLLCQQSSRLGRCLWP